MPLWQLVDLTHKNRLNSSFSRFCKAGKYQINMFNGKGDADKNIYLTKISKIPAVSRT